MTLCITVWCVISNLCDVNFSQVISFNPSRVGQSSGKIQCYTQVVWKTATVLQVLPHYRTGNVFEYVHVCIDYYLLAAVLNFTIFHL